MKTITLAFGLALLSGSAFAATCPPGTVIDPLKRCVCPAGYLIEHLHAKGSSGSICKGGNSGRSYTSIGVPTTTKNKPNGDGHNDHSGGPPSPPTPPTKPPGGGGTPGTHGGGGGDDPGGDDGGDNGGGNNGHPKTHHPNNGGGNDIDGIDSSNPGLNHNGHPNDHTDADGSPGHSGGHPGHKK